METIKAIGAFGLFCFLVALCLISAESNYKINGLQERVDSLDIEINARIKRDSLYSEHLNKCAFLTKIDVKHLESGKYSRPCQ